MDNSTQYNDQLMRYLDDEMDMEEKEIFEKELAGDIKLQEELDRLLEAREAIRSYGLKKEVESVHAEMMKELKVVTPVKKMTGVQKVIRYSVAVAAAIALIFLTIEGYKFYNLSPEKLYSEKYISYAPDNTRGDNELTSPIEIAYREKKYGEITRMILQRSLSPREAFLRGLAYLETGDLSRAITSFQSILTDTTKEIDRVTKDGTEYYLSLAHLKNRDYDEALELMNNIHEDPTHIYNERFSAKYVRRVKMLKWR